MACMYTHKTAQDLKRDKLPRPYTNIPFSAITFEAGFMIAESAVIGRRMGFPESARSMMITWAVSPTFSLTQMNLSDSKVRVANPICWTLMPTF